MKKLMTFILALVLSIPLLNAGVSYFDTDGCSIAVRDVVPVGGVYTLAYSRETPWKLKTVVYRFADATTTSDFTIQQISNVETISWTQKVWTNAFNVVETNAYAVKTSTVTTHTNTIYSGSTTNVQQVGLSADVDFPDNWYFMGGDTLVLTWTGATNFPFQVYGSK